MRNPESVILLLLSLAVFTACGERQPRDPSAANIEPATSFSDHAGDVFSALREEPLDSTFQTEIGLFGDMSVGAGELVVMRRYRYRVDSTEYGTVGHMAFQIRDARAPDEPVPVVLTFVARDRAWRLERAQYGEAVADSTTAAGAQNRYAGDNQSAMDRSPLHRTLRTKLDAWLSEALERTASSSGE